MDNDRKHDFDVPNKNTNAPRRVSSRESFKRGGFTPRQNVPSIQESAQKESQQTEPEYRIAVTVPTTSFWTQKSPVDKPFERIRFLLLFVLMVPLTIFAFYPAWTNICYAWYHYVDYGHGFIVLPLTAFFLYMRLDTYPGTRHRLTWLGLFPIAVCCAMRLYAASQYMDALEQLSIFFWLLGLVWFFYGTRVFVWALPSLMFLVFMFQLPYRFEALMKNELQLFAAQFAAILLQLFGEPAVAIKNTIRLSTMELGIEAACSGIRFLISIAALAAAWILLMRRPWWQNLLVALIAAPLALFVNAARIALTGILLIHLPDFVSRITPKSRNPSAVADEFSGYVMIAVACLLFYGFVWYLGKVFRQSEYV